MNVEMYNGGKSERTIDNIKIETHIAEMISCNTLKIEVGTTGYKGGDSGHGCRTYLRIENASSSDMEVTSFKDNFGHANVEIVLGGDTELSTFVGALEFAVRKLKEYTGNVLASEVESREKRFYDYINELVMHFGVTKKLNGMSKIREKYHVGGITKQQFFECGLHNAAYDMSVIPMDFCERIYKYSMGKEKEAPVW